MNWYEDLYNRQIYFDLYSEEDTRIAPREVDALIELVELKPGQSILDVCCGYGRHAIELARRGYQVTGIDLSPKQIEAAIERANREGLQVNFLVGDAREMGFAGEFDVTLNLFISFGLFEADSDNLKMLERVAAATSAGGLFLMDLWNREKVVRDFTERDIQEREDGIRIERRWAFDAWGGRVSWENTVLLPDGRKERWDQSVRAYTLVELKKMLDEVGLRAERVYGDFDGQQYTLDSPRMIIISRKAGG